MSDSQWYLLNLYLKSSEENIVIFHHKKCWNLTIFFIISAAYPHALFKREIPIENHKVLRVKISIFFIYKYYLLVYLLREGRPTTTISLPSHILLIFSSEPPCFQVYRSSIFCVNYSETYRIIPGGSMGKIIGRGIAEYFAIFFISRGLAITEAEEIKVLPK